MTQAPQQIAVVDNQLVIYKNYPPYLVKKTYLGNTPYAPH